MPFGNAKVQRPGRKLLIAAMAATFGMGLSGCNDDNNSSNTGGNTDNINAPKGTVQGAVIDTNGNPLAGARVFLDGREQTTGESGQYKFDNVAVTLANTPNNNTPAANAPIPVTIIPPAGYLGVNLQVGPRAQITSSDNGGLGGGQTNPQLVFVDGFNAGVGTVALPQLNTTVRGILRDSGTGQTIAGATINADFVQVLLDQGTGSNPQPGIAPGVAITGYQASGAVPQPVVTAADGSFSFTGLAADSQYNLSGRLGANDPVAPNGGISFAPEGAPCFAGGNSVPAALCITTNTIEGGNSVQLGAGGVDALSVEVSRLASADLLQPYLIAVPGAFDTTGATAVLLDSTVNGTTVPLRLRFSETVVGPFNTSTIRLLVRAPNSPVSTAQAPATVAYDAVTSTLTVTTAAALDPGTIVTVQVLREALRDAAGNAFTLTERAQPGQPQLTDPIPSNAFATADGLNYVNFPLRVFSPLGNSAPAPGVTGAGLGHLTAATNPNSPQFQSTAALIDVVSNSALLGNTTLTSAGTVITYGWNGSIEQLNGDGATNPTIRLALQRLNLALQNLASFDLGLGLFGGNAKPGVDLSARAPQGAQANADFIHPNTAVVRFSVPPEARLVVIGLQRNGVPLDVGFFPIGAGSGAEVVGRFNEATNAPVAKAVGNGRFRYVIDPKGATEVSVVIAGGAHNVGGVLTGNLFADIPKAGDAVVLDSLVVGALADFPSRQAQLAAAVGGTDASASVTLADVVPPTTEVQLTMDAIAASAQINIGGGGAVIGGQGANRGTPILPVTPQLLDVTDTTNTTPPGVPNVGAGGQPGSGYASDELRGAGDIGGLSRSRVVDDATTAGVNEATNASNQLDAFDATPGLLASGHNAIGTQDLSTAAGRVKRIGFAFTEPVTLTGTGSPTVVGVATPGFTLTNLASETRIDEDGKTVFLVTADVSDIFAFEAAARSTDEVFVDFTGLVRDAAGTVATAENNANARVALRDYLPPIMLRAFFDGTNFVFDFHEAVALNTSAAASTISLGNSGTCAGATVNLNTAANFMTAPARTEANLNGVANARIVLPLPAVRDQIGGLNVADCFPAGTEYAEGAIYTKASLGAATGLQTALIETRPRHFRVDYSGVQDTAGNKGLRLGAETSGRSNTWDRWEDVNPAPAVPGLGIDRPLFAGAAILGPFTVLPMTNPALAAGFSNGNQQYSFTVLFSHPIYFGGLGADLGTDFDAFRADVSNNGSLSQTELNQYCQDKFSKSNSMNMAGVAPTSCNPLDGTQAVINATGVGAQAGEFTATDLSRVSGLTVNFTAAPAASQDKFRLARADNVVRTISSALVTPRTLTGAGATLQSQGVVTRSDLLDPNFLFELQDRIAP